MKPMELGVSKDYQKCPEGQFISRLCGIIDIGTQEVVFDGIPSKKPQIYLQFEVFAEDEDGKAVLDNEGRPYLIGETFTAKMSTKGNLLAFVNSWRGKPLEEKDFPFDFKRMLGRYGMMTVTHNASKKDPSKIYANINGISPVPKKLAQAPDGTSILPTPVAEDFFIDLDDPDFERMNGLIYTRTWEAMQKKITSSPEYKLRLGGKPGAEVPVDEIPF